MFGKRVDLKAQEVVKYLPTSPPQRGDRVLVDGVRCTVTYCRVRWVGQTWTIRTLRVKAMSR